MVTKEKQEALEKRMKELGLKEEDLEESFILGSGPGGQKIQKTSSCVRIRHLPTGIEVKCQKNRSREINRFLARRELCEKFVERQNPRESAKFKRIEKIRKQKKKRERARQVKRENAISTNPTSSSPCSGKK